MENLASPLCLAMMIKKSLCQGDSLFVAIEQYLHENNDVFTEQIKEYWLKDHFLEDIDAIKCESLYSKELLFLIKEGLRGVPILEKIIELEQMMVEDCQRQIDRQAVILPYLGLLPIMMLMFPSLMLVILYPVLEQFLGAVV